ncbi:MAG: hypothetical protein J7485_10580 [Sphingobium sp.]|nr:hypothetical protein [Sphingobium sp.]
MTGAQQDRFHALSVRDLLDAREAYHVHLSNKTNVFATAIGLYLIRDDGDADDKKPGIHERKATAPPRRLTNSSVRDWSWPCVLVFVREWAKRKDMAHSPENIVPPFLYLPDGRVIPVCVVEAGPGEVDHLVAPGVYPSDLIGGGYPCLADVQGVRRSGSIGCLVTDGDGVFALTNRHVAGPEGREISTLVAGARRRIGISAGQAVGKKPFEQVYPGWAGSRVLANLDAGLVRVDDVNDWTAQVYGIGEMGPIFDLNTTNFDLNLIGLDVRAHGGTSGAISGQIAALFFRYKSVAGTDYVSDFLIGPRTGKDLLGTLPGDSGTLWFHDPAEPAQGRQAPRLSPIAMQWGGQALVAGDGGTSATYALASCLATICRELEVDIIADWNSGIPETWGVVGHVKVGALACELIGEAGFAADAKLKAVFGLNLENIGMSDAALHQSGRPDTPGFAPLADVADLVWRNTRKIDSSNHFADMDQVVPTGKFAGKSLIDLTKNGAHINPDDWNRFYADLGVDKRGALPFRVWSIADEMVDYARDGDVLRFVCAGGVMAHYLGDACQPLHISRLHHGPEGGSEAEKGVHEAYETKMLDANRDALIQKIAQKRAQKAVPQAWQGGGEKAALETVRLMHRTVKALPPLEIVELYNSLSGRQRLITMWQKLGDRTASRILDGAWTLAGIWQGTWAEGRSKPGAKPVNFPNQAFAHDELSALYKDKNFAPSYALKNLKLVNGRLVNTS